MPRPPAPKSAALAVLLLVVGVVLVGVWLTQHDRQGEAPSGEPETPSGEPVEVATASDAPPARQDLARWVTLPVPASPALTLKVLDKGRYRLGYDERAKSPAWAA